MDLNSQRLQCEQERRDKFDKFRWTRMKNLLDSARNSWVQSEKKRPHGSLEGTIQAKLRLQGATEPDAFEDGKVGDGDVLWPSITIFFQPLI